MPGAETTGGMRSAKLLQILFGTHPTTLERIGIGEAWARKR